MRRSQVPPLPDDFSSDHTNEDDEMMDNNADSNHHNQHQPTSSRPQRPQTAGTRRTATTAPTPAELLQHRHHRGDFNDNDIDNIIMENQSDANEDNFYNNEEEDQMNNNHHTDARSPPPPPTVSAAGNTAGISRRSHPHNSAQNSRFHQEGWTASSNNNTNNNNNNNGSKPDSSELSAFQRTMEMLSKLQRQQKQNRGNTNNNNHFNNNAPPPQQRRPQSATRTSQPTGFDHHQLQYQQQPQKSSSAAAAGNFRSHSARRSASAIDQEFNNIFDPRGLLHQSATRSSNTLQQNQQQFSPSSRVSESGYDNNRNDISSFSNNLHNQQHLQLLEQTQADLERATTEKHSLQRLVLELHQENADLKAGQNQAFVELEETRMRENDLQVALEELEIRIENGEFSSTSAVMVDEDGNRIIGQDDRDEREQHLSSSFFSSSSPSELETAVKKAMFIINGNFPTEITQSLFFNNKSSNPPQDNDNSNNDNDENNSNKIRFDELVNFLADRCIELCAARQQLDLFNRTQEEMMIVADEWDHHERDLANHIEELENDLEDRDEQISSLQFQLQKMASSDFSLPTPTTRDVNNNNNNGHRSKEKTDQDLNNNKQSSSFDHAQEEKTTQLLQNLASDFAKALERNNNNKQVTSQSKMKNSSSLTMTDELLHEAESQSEKLENTIISKMKKSNSAVITAEKPSSSNPEQVKLTSSSPPQLNTGGVSSSTNHWSNRPFLAVKSVFDNNSKQENGNTNNNEISESLIADIHSQINSSSFEALDILRKNATVRDATSTNHNHNILVETSLEVARRWGLLAGEDDRKDGVIKVSSSSAYTRLFVNSSRKKQGNTSSSSLTYIGVDPSSLETFLKVIERSYLDDRDGEHDHDAVTFHSSINATNIVQKLYLLLQTQHFNHKNDLNNIHKLERSLKILEDGDDDNGNNNAEDDFYYKRTNKRSAASPEDEAKRQLQITKLQDEINSRKKQLRPSLLESLGFEERLGLLLAAAGMYIGHPNLTEEYLVKMRDPIAIRYSSSSSVLNNYHTATLLSLDEAVASKLVDSSSSSSPSSSIIFSGINLLMKQHPDQASKILVPEMINDKNNNNGYSEDLEEVVENMYNSIIDFLSCSHDLVDNASSSLNINKNVNHNQKRQLWTLLDEIWTNGNLTFMQKSSPIVSNSKNRHNLAGSLLAGAAASSFFSSAVNNKKGRDDKPNNNNQDIPNVSVSPWLTAMREDCAHQRTLERTTGKKLSSSSSSDLMIKTSSRDAEIRSIVWLFDSKIIPIMTAIDTFNENFFSLTSKAIFARNFFAQNGGLPEVASDFEVNENTQRQVIEQSRSMMMTESNNGLIIDDTQNNNNDNEKRVVKTKSSTNNKSASSPSSNYTEEEVDAMRSSFGEIQKSLLETISEYQDALSNVLEEKKVLVQATTDMARKI